MITEDYVSFETAKLLKEKKFSVPCLNYYDSTKTIRTSYDYCGVEGVWANFNEINDVMYSAPTLQMTMKWLREVHKLYIIVRPYVTEEGILSLFEIKDIRKKNIIRNVQTKTGFNSVEEACESAIKYCIENLI